MKIYEVEYKAKFDGVERIGIVKEYAQTAINAMRKAIVSLKAQKWSDIEIGHVNIYRKDK